MPTVNELRSQIADETGLSTTADTSVIDRALNRALRRICAETDCLKATGTIAGDGSSVSVSLSSLTGLSSIDSVFVLNSSGVYSSLPLVSHDAVLGARPASSASMYAYEGGSLLLDGPVASTDSLYVRYVKAPTALAAGGAESTITANGIDVLFHEDLLANLAVVQILEGYEGDEQRAAYYRGLAAEAMLLFKNYLTSRAGNEFPNSRYGAPHFHSPEPLRIR